MGPFLCLKRTSFQAILSHSGYKFKFFNWPAWIADWSPPTHHFRPLAPLLILVSSLIWNTSNMLHSKNGLGDFSRDFSSFWNTLYTWLAPSPPLGLGSKSPSHWCFLWIYYLKWHLLSHLHTTWSSSLIYCSARHYLTWYPAFCLPSPLESQLQERWDF